MAADFLPPFDLRAFVSYLQLKSGAITFTQTVELKNKLDEKDSDILPL